MSISESTKSSGMDAKVPIMQFTVHTFKMSFGFTDCAHVHITWFRIRSFPAYNVWLYYDLSIFLSHNVFG